MKTAADIQSLKEEIQAWLEQHDLDEGTGWFDIEGHYKGKEPTFPWPHYLVLWFEGDFHEVIWLLPDHPNISWQAARRREFEAIIKNHGCWFECENNTTLCILDQQER
jgi:hypothetical protein